MNEEGEKAEKAPDEPEPETASEVPAGEAKVAESKPGGDEIGKKAPPANASGSAPQL